MAIGANVNVYDGLGFRSASLSTLLNEIKKTKLQTYTEPQAGINILCAPSMGKGIEDTLNIPESASLSQASWWSLLVSRKVVAVRHALKEARLQTPVLTNRNGIPRLTEVDK